MARRKYLHPAKKFSEIVFKLLLETADFLAAHDKEILQHKNCKLCKKRFERLFRKLGRVRSKYLRVLLRPRDRLNFRRIGSNAFAHDSFPVLFFSDDGGSGKNG